MTKKSPKRPTNKVVAKKTAKASAKPIGALSAAATVLKAANAPMTCQELIEAMAKKKLWTSPGGKTPANTLHAAMMKEINTKGRDSRFKKGERGKFSAA